jgi:diaminopimelate epimerase
MKPNFPENFFVKTHGLGNEYVVLDSTNITFKLTPNAIKRICNIHFGIGSDGILLLSPSTKADFKFQVFNPDASEAEKSGNGLRIFAKFLYDYKYTTTKKFTIETLGGIVTAKITEEKNGKAYMVTIEMGKANFKSSEIPVKCDLPECQNFPLQIGSKQCLINCVSVGNPHCVIVCDKLDKDEVLEYGPQIEGHPMFPNRINVQFAKVISPSEVEILIFERGAGFTMASGSSSSAVASVMRKKGLVNENVTIKMLGGNLNIGVDNDWNVTLCGEVRQIAEGVLNPELISDLEIEILK